MFPATHFWASTHRLRTTGVESLFMGGNCSKMCSFLLPSNQKGGLLLGLALVVRHWESCRLVSRVCCVTLSDSSHWLAHHHERGARAGLYLTRTVSPDTSVTWRRGQKWSSKRWLFLRLTIWHG
jgi:hypothetical protein